MLLGPHQTTRSPVRSPSPRSPLASRLALASSSAKVNDGPSGSITATLSGVAVAWRVRMSGSAVCTSVGTTTPSPDDRPQREGQVRSAGEDVPGQVEPALALADEPAALVQQPRTLRRPVRRAELDHPVGGGTVAGHGVDDLQPSPGHAVVEVELRGPGRR